MAQEEKKNFFVNPKVQVDNALNQFAQVMIEKIESIDRDWRKPWFTEGSLNWPRNLHGRKYNGANALMLMMHQEKQGYKLPIYGTFDAIQRLNFQDRKNTKEKLPFITINQGEKSFPVMLTTFTVVKEDTNEKIKYEDYKKLSLNEQAKYKVFPKAQVYRVFNIAQTNIEQARKDLFLKMKQDVEPKRVKKQEGKMTFPAVDEIIKKNLWVCKISPEHQDMAYYDIRKDEIVIPEKEQFKDEESFYGTLFHEMTHSTGAESRLKRFTEEKGWGLSNNFYAREELIAEMGAALIGSKYGLEKHLKDDSASYLKSWLNSLKEDPKYIKTVLDDVRKASYQVGERIDLVQSQINAYQAKPGQENSYPNTYDFNINKDSLKASNNENNKTIKEDESQEQEIGMKR